MAHAIQFEPTEGGLVLAQAILLYRSDARVPAASAGFASIHPVEDQQGQPVIGAGTPLTRAHLRRWADALDRAAPPEILPERVLVAHPDCLAWWVPEQVLVARMDLTSPPKGLKALGHRTSVHIPWPAHLLVASRRELGVYALPTNKRPTATTELRHSPVLNVFLNGTLCWGNVVRPKALTVGSIPLFEAAVFDSWSTHPNPGQELTVTGKGGLVRLLDQLAAKRTTCFPIDRMKPFDPSPRRTARSPFTVGQVIAGAHK